MQVVLDDRVETFSYSSNARFRQLWRIPANFAFFGFAAIYAYYVKSSLGVICSVGFIVALIPQTLWIASWHPDLRLDAEGVTAWRFGICLQKTQWNAVTEITKQYRRVNLSTFKLSDDVTKELRTDGEHWRVEIKGRKGRLFTTVFSNRISNVERLVSLINLKIQEFKIPVRKSASKRP